MTLGTFDGAFVLAGAVTGFAVGLTGIGGGALMTPILLLLFGIAPRTAVGTDLWFAVFTKVVAATVHSRGGRVDWKVVSRLWFGSLPATCVVVVLVALGTSVGGYGWLSHAIGLMVVITALGLLFASRARMSATGRADASPSWAVLAGVVLGACVSLTSVGAGALGTIALLYLYPSRMNPHTLVATDIVHAIPVALVAGSGYLLAGLVDAGTLMNLLLGSIPAAIAGSLLSRRFSPRWLKFTLALCLLAVGVRTLLA
jgi:uncharacterized membrane protein YfcA